MFCANPFGHCAECPFASTECYDYGYEDREQSD